MHFTIQDFNEFSNHAPLEFSLKIGTTSKTYKRGRKTFVKWNPIHKEAFLSELSGDIANLELSLKRGIDNNDDAEELASMFTQYLTSKGNPYFAHTINCDRNQFDSHDKNKQKWYNAECESKRKEYKDALYNYNQINNESNRQSVLEKKKSYKYYCRKCKTYFNRTLGRKMDSMKSKSPKDFWKMFKKRSPNPNGETIELNEFVEHFKNLAKNEGNINNENSINFVRNFDSNHNSESIYPELDRYITIEEIIMATKRLGNNKACSSDNIIYEYFKESVHVIGDALELLFNHILKSGKFPHSWSTGLIIPLYKKGDPSIPNNYRGITLVSCFAKLFTSILNERLQNWATANDILTDAQFGFKPGYSTVDALFVLQSLIESHINNKQKLFCCFVDYLKAYDLTDRMHLWFKLIRSGIDGKFLSVFRSLYNQIKLGVKHMNSISDLFESDIGLLQGEICSPIMFSLFLNDIELHLQADINAGITIDQLSIYLLLFADDAVLISESAEGLQSSMNNLFEYCTKWNITVNVDKTKIVIFHKGRLKKAIDGCTIIIQLKS